MAERARARSGYAVAARALERAAQLTPAPERRVERAIAAADAFWRAGRGARAEELLTARAEARDPLLRADAEHLLGRLAHLRGDPPRRATSSWPGRCAEMKQAPGPRPKEELLSEV